MQPPLVFTPTTMSLRSSVSLSLSLSRAQVPADTLRKHDPSFAATNPGGASVFFKCIRASGGGRGLGLGKPEARARSRRDASMLRRWPRSLQDGG